MDTRLLWAIFSLIVADQITTFIDWRSEEKEDYEHAIVALGMLAAFVFLVWPR